MVKFRGISLSIVSQFDICKLPEFSIPPNNDSSEPSPLSKDGSVASCFVPIYPGSQIWLEYSVDAPHPPNAMYFFKMLHNGKVVTSFDCTTKHGYYGKAVYNFQHVGRDNLTNMPAIMRQSFKFSPTYDKTPNDPMNDYIEVRVHRIEHRKRVSVETAPVDASANEDTNAQGFCLVGGGLVDNHLQRRYKYQLLDPADEPYATFRFYYRSFDFFLEREDLVKASSPTSS